MMSENSLFLRQVQLKLDDALSHLFEAQVLPEAFGHSAQLFDAMHYSLTNGGKRLRAALFVAAFEAVSSTQFPDQLMMVAMAIEALHAYSLVHDDLPAMDDDDLRRGKATCHIAYDEATAILVGDALQTLAFELIAETETLTDTQRLQMIRTLAKASGAQGMVLGQALDLYAEQKSLTLDQLSTIHRLKTGALIRASVQLGAIAANATTKQLKALEDYAEHLGLAFQIQDDILDVEGDTDTLGKPQGADQALNKSTYPELLGLNQAKQKARDTAQLAKAALQPLPEKSTLAALVNFAVKRTF